MDWFLVKFYIEGLCPDLPNHLEFDIDATRSVLHMRT
jgi:hypothetical protein